VAEAKLPAAALGLLDPADMASMGHPGSWLALAKTAISDGSMLDPVGPARQGDEEMSIAKTSEDDRYLLAGQASELERLQLQSRVWEPSGRQLLAEIGDGRSPSPGRWLRRCGLAETRSER
jgi:hypothetical protein